MRCYFCVHIIAGILLNVLHAFPNIFTTALGCGHHNYCRPKGNFQQCKISANIILVPYFFLQKDKENCQLSSEGASQKHLGSSYKRWLKVKKKNIRMVKQILFELSFIAYC